MSPAIFIAPTDPKDVNPNEKADIDREIEHFRPFALARPTIDDPAFTPIYISRHLTHNRRGHTLMAATFNTPETISNLLSFFRQAKSPSDISSAEVRRFYSFGTGLTAHANILHGGVIACILDSTMSNAAGLVIRNVIGGSESVVTVQLNLRYQKAVTTPAMVMVRAWATKIENEGRKIWVAAECVSGENGEISHAKAEGLWLRIVMGKL